MRCSNCGGLLKEDTKTCPACGAEVIVKQPAEAEEKGGGGVRAAKSLAGLTAKKGVAGTLRLVAMGLTALATITILFLPLFKHVYTGKSLRLFSLFGGLKKLSKEVIIYFLASLAFGIGGIVYAVWTLFRKHDEYICYSPRKKWKTMARTNKRLAKMGDGLRFIHVGELWIGSAVFFLLMKLAFTLLDKVVKGRGVLVILINTSLLAGGILLLVTGIGMLVVGFLMGREKEKMVKAFDAGQE